MAEKAEKSSKKSWFDGLKAEFKKIIWPDRKSLVKQTGAVVAVSIVLGVMIAVLDFIFQYGIDILVNCAGVFPQALIEDITDEDWSRVMRINLDGAFYACRAAAPYLKKSGKNGRIINLSSQAALNGTAHGVHYGASKAALLGLTYCLAKELGPDGITVNAILPGRIDTEMLAYATPERRAQWLQSTPLGRFGDTADIAELAVFLASDKGGYITGAKINVNGGLSTG